MSEQNHDEILNRPDASKFLKTNPRTLDYLVSTGQIPYSRIGKRGVVFLKSRLLEWLREREGIAYHRPTKASK
jgi:predicted DNA-binding transcriptional regulator AlpA